MAIDTLSTMSSDMMNMSNIQAFDIGSPLSCSIACVMAYPLRYTEPVALYAMKPTMLLTLRHALMLDKAHTAHHTDLDKAEPIGMPCDHALTTVFACHADTSFPMPKNIACAMRLT